MIALLLTPLVSIQYVTCYDESKLYNCGDCAVEDEAPTAYHNSDCNCMNLVHSIHVLKLHARK